MRSIVQQNEIKLHLTTIVCRILVALPFFCAALEVNCCLFARRHPFTEKTVNQFNLCSRLLPWSEFKPKKKTWQEWIHLIWNSTDSTSRKELKRTWCTAPEIFEGLMISTGYEIDASHRVSVDSNDTVPIHVPVRVLDSPRMGRTRPSLVRATMHCRFGC